MSYRFNQLSAFAVECEHTFDIELCVGTLTVNGQTYTGSAPGSFQGLSLVENLYLGGVPDYSKISKFAAFNSGYEGNCFVLISTKF